MDDAYLKDLAALRPYLAPALHDYLARPAETRARRTGQKTAGTLNIEIGGQPLYPDGAQAHSAAQVDAFLENPVRRISFVASNFLFEADQFGQGPGAEPFTPRPLNAASVARVLPEEGESVAGDLARRLLAAAEDATLPWFPAPDTGHLLSVGLGLGLHLKPLVDALPFANLILVDPYPEFLRLSLGIADWAGLIATLEGRGGGLHLLFGSDPAALELQVEGALRGRDYARIDGTYIFQHYAAQPLPQVIELLQQKNAVIERGKGFFEDEVLMLRNTARNLTREARMLSPGGGFGARSGEAMILGSGPSADTMLDDIRRLRTEGMALFTAGTGLGVALRNGIVPDFHCEIENLEAISEVVGHLAKEHDFRPITLIAPFSIDESVARLFENPIFIYRDSNVGTRLFGSAQGILDLSGPTVSNLAARAAIAFGFERLYLFGTDLGSREAERHHASDSVYNIVDDEHYRTGMGMDALEIPVQGNFGGTAYTSRAFLSAANFFELLIRQYPDCAILNCSDGIAISGAAPTPTRSLVCSGMITPDDLSRRIAAATTAVRGRAAAPHRVMTDWAGALTAWRDGFKAVVAEAATVDAIITAAQLRLALADDGWSCGIDAAVQASLSGTLNSLFQLAYAIDRRLPQERRAAFLSAFKDVVSRAVDLCEAKGRALADETRAEEIKPDTKAEGSKV